MASKKKRIAQLKKDISDLQKIIDRNLFDNQKDQSILQRITNYQELLKKNTDSDAYYYMARDYAELANDSERQLRSESKIFYEFAFRYYNQAIALDHNKEEYRQGRNLLPSLIQDPDKRVSMYKDVILRNIDDASKWRELIQVDSERPIGYYYARPIKMRYKDIEKRLAEFEEKRDVTISAGKKNYIRDFFLSSAGAVLGAVGLLGIGLSAVIAWPIAVVAGLALFGGSSFFERKVYLSSKKQAELGYLQEVDQFLRDELQNSIDNVKDAKESYLSAKEAGKVVSPESNWGQRILNAQNSHYVGSPSM